MMRFGWMLILLAAVSAIAAPESRPTTAPVDPPAATPKEALHSLNLAQRDGDAAAIRSLFVAGDLQGEQLIVAMSDYAAALAALHGAAERAYGPEGANIVAGDVQAESAKALAAIEKAEVVTDGKTASVKYAGATDAPIRLIKVGGRWKLPVAQLLDGADTKAEEKGIKELTAQGRIARSIAAEIAAGKFREGANKAKEVWRSRLLEPTHEGGKSENRNPK